MDNKESILDELTNFEKGKLKEITPLLDEYLARIAKTGDTIFPWVKLKPLIKTKMEVVMVEFHETCPLEDYTPCPNVDRFMYDLMKEKLLEAIDKFNNSPFTIQRICELLTAPLQHYKHVDKFMRGLEKNVLVVSTVEPGCSHIFACDCARKRAEHNNSITVNGITDSRTPLNGEETYKNPFGESDKIAFQSSEAEDQNSHSSPPQQTEVNTSDHSESNGTVENGEDEPVADVSNPSNSTIESSSSQSESQELGNKDEEGSPTRSVDTIDETVEADSEDNKSPSYSSDDTVSSSTHCPATTAGNANVATSEEEAESSESQKRSEDEQPADFDQVSGKDAAVTNATNDVPDKCEDEVDSNSQDGDSSTCEGGVSPPTNVEATPVDEVDKPTEASSSEEETPVDESTDSTTCEFHKGSMDTEMVHTCTAIEVCMVKAEEEQQPSSSNMESDDAARSSGLEENEVSLQPTAATIPSPPPSESEQVDDEAMDVVSTDTVASEMSEGHFSSIAKLPLSFDLQPESSSPLSSLPSSPPALSPNDLDCTSFSAASSSSPQILPNDEVSNFSESSLTGRSPEACTDIPEPMEED